MANFGALTDHFGILAVASGGGTIADVAELVESSAVPVAESRAEALDENGDPADTVYHGNDGGTVQDITCKYVLKSGTLALSVLDLGELTAGVIASQIEVATNNGGWPEITVTGQKGLQTVAAPSSYTNLWSLPAITITGAKRAQVMGFSVTTGRLTSSSLSVSCEIAQQNDGLGEPVAHGVSGGQGEVNAELVMTTDDAPAIALAAPFDGATYEPAIMQAVGLVEGQAAHHTSTAKIGFTLTRDEA